MGKLFEIEWIKFKKNKKNKLLLLLLILYIVILVFYNQKQYKNYFSKMSQAMNEEKIKANSRLKMIELFMKNDEDYSSNPLEQSYLNKEIQKSTLLGYYYKEKDFADWRRFLQIENEKYSNLILGEENNFIDKKVLYARGQGPLELKSKIIRNEYFIDNNIEPYINPYELNGVNFLILLLKNNNPVILIAFLALFAIDIFSGEMEEGSYKLYYTQPLSRACIFWSKIISTLIFIVGLTLSIVFIGFFIISLIYGVGDFTYPQIIGLSKGLLASLNSIIFLGEFKIISSLEYIIKGYILLFLIATMLILFIISLSILFKSISINLGAFASIFLLDYVLNIFLNFESMFRFYLPLNYMRVGLILSGEINASYIAGIQISLICSVLLLIINCNLFVKKDLIGGNI